MHRNCMIYANTNFTIVVYHHVNIQRNLLNYQNRANMHTGMGKGLWNV
jgi:hypothetical protein